MTRRRPSLEASPLYALLSSIVAASLGGCSGQARGQDPQGETDGTRDTEEDVDDERPVLPRVAVATTPDPPPPRPDRPGVMLYCKGDVPSRVRGLNAAYDYDSFAYYSGSTGHLATPPDFALVEVDGEPCASSPEPAACNAEVEHARAQSASWWHYDDFFSSSWTLLLATQVSGEDLGALNRSVSPARYPPYVSRPLGGTASADAGAVDAGAPGGAGADAGLTPPSGTLPVVTIDYIDELIAFLGRIDTPNEAALVMFANGRPIQCAMQQEGEDYIARGTWQISDCPITTQAFELRVTPEGSFEQIALGEPSGGGACVGRKPDGLCATDAAASKDPSAAWLAHTAHLEGAAVVAFALLEADLAALGAPAQLLGRVRRAAREEMVHAELVGQLASARGAEPAPVVVRGRGERTALQIALENAVEGCVRECWGALCAHFQARTARAAHVRAVWSAIAWDETEHAQLSRDVAAWLDARLTPEERLEVAAARASAIVALRRELDAEVAPSLVSELGLPNRAAALAQFDALTRQLLAPEAS